MADPFLGFFPFRVFSTHTLGPQPAQTPKSLNTVLNPKASDGDSKDLATLQAR